MKRTITLQKAFSLLEDCKAIIIDDDVLIYPSLSDLINEPDNEFCYLQWEIEDLDFNVRFNEGANQNPTISDNYLVLIDTEGEACSFKLLTVMDI